MIDLLIDDLGEVAEAAKKLEKVSFSKRERARVEMLLLGVEQKMKRLSALREALRRVLGIGNESVIRVCGPDTRRSGSP